MQNNENPRAAVLSFLVSIGLMGLGLLAGCSKPQEDSAAQPKPATAVTPPTALLAGNVHTVTLVAAQPLDAKLAELGFTRVQLPANYPQSVKVEAGAWGVSEAVANAATYWQGPGADGPKLRVLVAEVPAFSSLPGQSADEQFMREKVGFSGALGNPAAGVDAQVAGWSFLTTTSTLKVRDHLRAAGAPVSYGPVAISTPYLGDHEIILTRTPSGRFVEIIRNSAE
jgi:hypothetical protein